METKENVRTFYDQIGWKVEADGYYQNARYEDLRPVSAQYIHDCHLRITPYLAKPGKTILDLGCGPIQYPEYLTYSATHEYRVCCDISLTALLEARKRIGDHGLFVVGDAANLPFAPESIDDAVSLHTLHHLDLADQKNAWGELYRVLKPGATAVVVNGWTESSMMKRAERWIRIAEALGQRIAVWRGREKPKPKRAEGANDDKTKATGTFVQKLNADWIRTELSKVAPSAKVTIACWRSVSVRWLRALIHPPYGKYVLRKLFEAETANPAKYGEEGQYPLIVMEKAAN